jgi:hypothetical protein
VKTENNHDIGDDADSGEVNELDTTESALLSGIGTHQALPHGRLHAAQSTVPKPPSKGIRRPM